MLLTFVILLLWLGWIAAIIFRRLKRSRKLARRETFKKEIRQKILEICDFARRHDRFAFIDRGLPGYTTMFVYPDFQVRLAELGRQTEASQDYRAITHGLGWWTNGKHLMVTLADDQVLFHAASKDADAVDIRLMPFTHAKEDASQILDLLSSFHEYLGLPGGSAEPQKSPTETLVAQPSHAVAPRERKQYDVSAENKMAHIAEYIEDGDHRTFFDMFGGEQGDQIVLWVDHREDDADIPKMCDSILHTGALDGRWADDDTLDLIITYKGAEHRVRYPCGFADRDTTMIALNRCIRETFELRYCMASDGNDTAAFLPLSLEQWDMLESRYPDKLPTLFTPVTEGFRKFGGGDH
jgi:hypothetical protein